SGCFGDRQRVDVASYGDSRACWVSTANACDDTRVADTRDVGDTQALERRHQSRRSLAFLKRELGMLVNPAA
ncbi:MAG TPA: hypothetical protein VHZ95_14125, partial [Polyangiales bacterium]|nr:hypothetical protein [Polyangiales bacterium]